MARNTEKQVYLAQISTDVHTHESLSENETLG